MQRAPAALLACSLVRQPAALLITAGPPRRARAAGRPPRPRELSAIPRARRRPPHPGRRAHHTIITQQGSTPHASSAHEAACVPVSARAGTLDWLTTEALL